MRRIKSSLGVFADLSIRDEKVRNMTMSNRLMVT